MIDEGGILVWKIAIKSSKLKPGKKKMLSVGKKMILVGQFDEGDGYYATEALCRHMRDGHSPMVVR